MATVQKEKNMSSVTFVPGASPQDRYFYVQPSENSNERFHFAQPNPSSVEKFHYASSEPINFIPAKSYRPAGLPGALDYKKDTFAPREIIIDGNYSKNEKNFYNKIRGIIKDFKIPAELGGGKKPNRVILKAQTEEQFYGALKQLLKFGEVKFDFDKAIALKHLDKLI